MSFKHSTSSSDQVSWCPAGCERTRDPNQYLCPVCWRFLPATTRYRLRLRDARATLRLLELHRQLRRQVPIPEIEVSP